MPYERVARGAYLNLRKFLFLGAVAAVAGLAPGHASADTISLSTDPFVDGSTQNGNFTVSSDNSPFDQPAPLTKSICGTDGSSAASASASLSTSVNFGAMSVSASGSTTVTPGNGVLIRAGNDVGAAPIADYHDDLIVNSNTLAVGTAVTLQFVETLISTTASTGISGGNSFGTAQVDGFYNIQDIRNGVAPISGSFSGNPQSGNGILAPDANNTTPGMDKTIVVDVQADVGDEVQFQNLLYAFGEADSDDGTGDNSFSYSGTYDTTISMLTPDASFTTQSGALYSASVGAVPEPTTWTMLLFGLFGVGFISRRARRKGAVAAA